MQHLDVQVIKQALEWSQTGHTVWLCTVLSTFGSSPREPGSMMVARGNAQHVGSLSGGCVEDDFLEQLQNGAWQQPVQTVRYGDPADDHSGRPQIRLPCGGILDVLVEKLPASAASQHLLTQLLNVLEGQQQALRQVDLSSGESELSPLNNQGGDRIELCGNKALIRIGPASRLIICGLSTVAKACADFAVTLGYEVIVCEPREEVLADFDLTGVRLERKLPSSFIKRAGNCHAQTAVVAMTHDPRIDDLAMIEAVKTDAFYIGVMGSRKTSDARASRLMRVGGLTAEQLERIHMPIGLALGSKTPAEIALAAMADILRVQRGRARDDL